MAILGVSAKSTTTLTVTIYQLDTNYSFSNRTCTWYLDGVRQGTSRLPAYASSGGDFMFEGLTPGTSYYILVEILAPTWSSSVDLDITGTTDAITITPWSWYASNGSATAAQTLRAYNAASGKGLTSNFSYLVWNDLVDKVKEVLDVKGYIWRTNYASLSATKMTSSSRVLTATRFNSLRFNIGAHYSTGINEVYSGDTVYGWYLTTLAYCLNQWINS